MSDRMYKRYAVFAYHDGGEPLLVSEHRSYRGAYLSKQKIVEGTGDWNICIKVRYMTEWFDAPEDEDGLE